jgi:flavin reductase (DIM6/NTAB) family NADH-FMN oxidoreductase RutF
MGRSFDKKAPYRYSHAAFHEQGEFVVNISNRELLSEV